MYFIIRFIDRFLQQRYIPIKTNLTHISHFLEQREVIFHLKVYRKYTNIETVEKVEKKSQLCEGCRIVKSETASDYI
jgi:hypothetical protein